VDLDGDDPFLRDRFVRLRVVDRFQAVDEELDVLALAADDVLIPVVALEDLVDGLGIGFGEDRLAA
jgi:hypothetical protein